MLNLLPLAFKDLLSEAFKGICRNKSRFLYFYFCVIDMITPPKKNSRARKEKGR